MKIITELVSGRLIIATSSSLAILSGTDVAAANNPLKPGEGGTSQFIPGEPGTYYYICTVPGHREMGMVGTIIVE